MRWGILAVLLPLGLFGSPAFAQRTQASVSALDPALERCIRENAPKVELAVNDLSAATTFLTQSVCANESAAVTQAQMRAQTEAIRARMQQMCDASKAPGAASAHVGNGEESYDACQMVQAYGGAEETMLMANLAPTEGGPAATSLAARMLLDLRLAHTSH